MKVNILGTEFTVTFADEAERPKLKSCDGYMDFSIKEIVVGKFEPDESSIENLDEYTKKVLRHEIIHAFFYESGLHSSSGDIEAWATNEEMVDWIAIQFPKILKAFQECDCI